jgi:hypothetical protein
MCSLLPDIIRVINWGCEMVGKYRRHEVWWNRRRDFGGGNLKERGYVGYLGINGRITLKWVFKEIEWKMWQIFIWLQLVTSGGLLWMLWFTFGSHKVLKSLDCLVVITKLDRVTFNVHNCRSANQLTGNVVAVSPPTSSYLIRICGQFKVTALWFRPITYCWYLLSRNWSRFLNFEMKTHIGGQARSWRPEPAGLLFKKEISLCSTFMKDYNAVCVREREREGGRERDRGRETSFWHITVNPSAVIFNCLQSVITTWCKQTVWSWEVEMMGSIQGTPLVGENTIKLLF